MTTYRPIRGAANRRAAAAPVVSDDQYKAVADAWRARQNGWHFDLKWMAKDLTEVGAASGDVNARPAVVSPDYVDGIAAPAGRPLSVAELFHQETTSSNLIRVVKSREDSDGSGGSGEGAAYGAVGETVAPHDYIVADTTAKLTTTEDFLADVPSAMNYLTKRMGYLVQRAEERKLVYGSGVNEPLGLVNAEDADEHAVNATQGADTVAAAVLKLVAAVFEQSGMLPTWALMNPIRWLDEAGATTAGFTSRDSMDKIWGMNAAVSRAISHDTIVVGSEEAAGRWVHTSGVRVEQSDEYSTYFGEGKVLVRAKIRTALAYERPSGIGVLTMAS